MTWICTASCSSETKDRVVLRSQKTTREGKGNGVGSGSARARPWHWAPQDRPVSGGERVGSFHRVHGHRNPERIGDEAPRDREFLALCRSDSRGLSRWGT